MRRVLVEYTKEVTAYSGHKTLPDGSEGEQRVIPAGTRRKVDAASAKVLVKDGVAKLVGPADERAEARAAVKAAEPAGGDAA